MWATVKANKDSLVMVRHKIACLTLFGWEKEAKINLLMMKMDYTKVQSVRKTEIILNLEQKNYGSLINFYKVKSTVATSD